jgi:16S rRNA (cytidine1402-2'-O)-methyltransferase
MVARELTKLHEEFRLGTLADLASYYGESEPRGEITVIVAGRGEPASPETPVAEILGRASQLLSDGLTRKAVVQRLVADLGVPRNEAYRIVTSLP